MSSLNQHNIRHLAGIAARQTWQQLLHADGRIIAVSQLLLLSCLLCLMMTIASIQASLQQNIEQLLGADMVISLTAELSPAQRQKLASMATGLSYARLHDITLTNNDKWQTGQIKLVDSAYPLQGELKIGQYLGHEGVSIGRGPQPNEIWLDSRFYQALGINIGDPVTIAGHTLVVSAILVHEPDRLLEGHSVAMRAMASIEGELASSLQPEHGTHRYAILATNAQAETIKDWSTGLATARVLSKQTGHPLASFWQRTQNFLGLVATVLLLMMAIAFNMAGQRQNNRDRFRFSLYYSFGMSRPMALVVMLLLWLFQFLLLLIPASLVALLLGDLILSRLESNNVLPLSLGSAWQAKAWLQASTLTGLLTLLLHLPNWFALVSNSTGQLLKQQSQAIKPRYQSAFTLLGISALALIFTDNPLLSAMTLSGLAMALGIMLIFTWLLLALANILGQKQGGMLAFCIYLMRQRLASKGLQIMGLGLCLTLVLFCLMLMRDFSSALSVYSRDQDGNLLVSQANQEQADALGAWAQKHDSEVIQLKPYQFAQLTHVNQVPLHEFAKHPSEALATVSNQIRLHNTQAVPDNNLVLRGEWWQATDNDWQQISAEEEVLTDLGLNLGDILRFQVGESALEFTLVAEHGYKPGAGAITFWFQIPATAREKLPVPIHYMGSLELPDHAWPELGDVWQQFPTLKMLPMKEVMTGFDQVLSLVNGTLLSFAALLLIMTLLVIAATVQGYLAADKVKNGLLLSFGYSKADCVRLSLYEWLVTGIIAAIGAVFGTLVIGNMMYQSQFAMPYRPDILWLGLSCLSALVLTTAIGAWSNRAGLNIPARQLLMPE